jgi:hypothetical protein
LTQAAIGSEGLYGLAILLEKARQSYQKAQFFSPKKASKKLSFLPVLPSLDHFKHGVSNLARIT